MIYVLDLDDFHQQNAAHVLPMLAALRGVYPTFRVTLFTIPRLCTTEFIKDMQAISWIDIVPHGWAHRTSKECANWTAEQMGECLDNIESMGFLTRGFKAPGWQISDACYRVLYERGYWLADKEYNNARRPRGLPVYLLDQPWKIHGHVGSTIDNDLTRIYPKLLSLPVDTEFCRVQGFALPWRL